MRIHKTLLWRCFFFGFPAVGSILQKIDHVAATNQTSLRCNPHETSVSMWCGVSMWCSLMWYKTVVNAATARLVKIILSNRGICRCPSKVLPRPCWCLDAELLVHRQDEVGSAGISPVQNSLANKKNSELITPHPFHFEVIKVVLSLLSHFEVLFPSKRVNTTLIDIPPPTYFLQQTKKTSTKNKSTSLGNFHVQILSFF